MFGFMIADMGSLSPALRARYRGCYCGVCRAIGRRCGQLSRCCLTYDVVFLALTLNGLYEPGEETERKPCPVHPFRRRESWRSEATDYAADLNVLLAQLNCLDDWQDERKPLKWAEAKLLERPAAEAAERWPRQWAAIRENLSALSELEKRREPSPDPAANAFGRLMGELFVLREEDHWAPALRAMGERMGRFIYLLDAVLDQTKDRRRGLYNPLETMTAEGATHEDLRDILTELMADCAARWEKLPILRDAELQRSILYSGVWRMLPVMEGKQK